MVFKSVFFLLNTSS